jgi:hypothetical protein
VTLPDDDIIATIHAAPPRDELRPTGRGCRTCARVIERLDGVCEACVPAEQPPSEHEAAVAHERAWIERFPHDRA